MSFSRTELLCFACLPDGYSFAERIAAAAQAGEELLAETLGHRVPPGEGVVDWPRLLSILEASGVDCPMGTEMFSNAVKAMPLPEASEYLYQTLQRPFNPT